MYSFNILLKAADSIFLPKYFFLQDVNPSLQELSNNLQLIPNYNVDHIFTCFCYYKHFTKLSINKDGRACYNRIREIDIGKDTSFLYTKSEDQNQDLTKEIINNFTNYYYFDKYSNVKFVYRNEI